MNVWDYYNLLNTGRPFKFDYLIWLSEGRNITIEHIKNRNSKIINNEKTEAKQDIEIEDTSYIETHINDFSEYFPIYIQKFKAINPNIKIIKISNVPNKNTETAEFDKLIENIYNKIKRG